MSVININDFITYNTQKFQEFTNSEQGEQALAAMKLAVRIAVFFAALGVVGIILWKLAYPIMELIVAVWPLLLAIGVLLICVGLISAETFNGMWATYRLGAPKVGEFIQWSICKLKDMQAERKQ